MEPTGGTPRRSGPLPPRQTWHPARRWLFVTIFVLFSAGMVLLGIAWGEPRPAHVTRLQSGSAV